MHAACSMPEAGSDHPARVLSQRRFMFFGEMDRVVPWTRLIALIEPPYPKSGPVGRQPIGMPKMQGMCCLQK